MLTVLLLPMMAIGQDVEIHRCLQADGTIAFQELPCAEAVYAGDGQVSKDDSGVENAPSVATSDVDRLSNESAERPSTTGPRLPPSAQRAECEKVTRDAIDAIDDEIRKNVTEEARKTYLTKLLDLTNQLRACKQL